MNFSPVHLSWVLKSFSQVKAKGRAFQLEKKAYAKAERQETSYIFEKRQVILTFKAGIWNTYLLSMGMCQAMG